MRSGSLGSLGLEDRIRSRSLMRRSVNEGTPGDICLRRPAGTLCLTAVSKVSLKNFSRVGVGESLGGQAYPEKRDSVSSVNEVQLVLAML